MEKSEIWHTCILNVFTAAAKVCSRCQGNIRKRKSFRTSIDSITTTSEVLVSVMFLEASTVELLFAEK